MADALQREETVSVELRDRAVGRGRVIEFSIRELQAETAKAKAEGVSENQTRDEMMSGTTLHTFIPQRHIASMIGYLCSDFGSTITGQALSVDGGLESIP